jgi:RNA polymerase sigma factor (sigma-70 family)
LDATESDEVLVQRCQAGLDPDAFRSLMERYYVSAHRLVSSILGSRFSGDVEDVMQEVFIRVHYALRSFRGDAKFGTWLFRIVYNQSLNYKSRALRQSAPVSTSQRLDLVVHHEDPTSALDNAQLRSVLDAAIDRLPTEYQVSLRLFYWFQLPIIEIASISAISENTVKSYLHRARKLLAHDLMRRKEDL